MDLQLSDDQLEQLALIGELKRLQTEIAAAAAEVKAMDEYSFDNGTSLFRAQARLHSLEASRDLYRQQLAVLRQQTLAARPELDELDGPSA